MLRKVPLIVILGSTGTGKTKLSIELAQRFGGEVISADSMQVYTDLDVVTAKATKAEQETVPHHLLDITRPSVPFTVKHFQNQALPIIDGLLSASKCPIVVGGTNYYIESLLWEVLFNGSRSPLSSSGEASGSAETMTQAYSPTPSTDSSELELETVSTEELHERLKQIDPITAGRIHPNNRRKILRALEVFHDFGIPLSEVLNQQRSKPGGNRLGGPLRYPHTVLLWLRCDQDVLNQRLDKRVDSMLKQGLLPEVRNFYEKYVKTKNDNKYTEGLLQSIGFKEFVPYLEKFGTDQDTIIENYLQNVSFTLPEEPAANEPQGLDILRKCLEELKLVTRRYSKRQIKWIKNRFLGSQDRQVPSLYSLDTSDVNQWDASVYLPAIDIIESYVDEKIPRTNPTDHIQHPGSGLNEEVPNFCDVCKRHFVGEFQWNLHLASNKHKRAKDGLKKKLKRLQDDRLNKK